MHSTTNNQFSNGDKPLNTRSSHTAVNIDLDNVDGKGSQDCKEKPFRDQLHEYGNETTHHGIRYVTNPGNHLLRRLFWATIILAADTYLVFNVVNSIIRFYDYDVNTVVGVKYVADLDFPAVTICNYNQIRKSVASPLELALTNAVYGLETQFNGNAINWTLFDEYLGNDTSTRQDLVDSMVFLAHQINDTVFECTWRGVQPCDARNFTTTLTDYGVCFTFNDPKDKSKVLKINQPGKQNGLLLRMDVHQFEYVSGESSAAGFKVILHPQGVRPVVKELGFSVSPGFETSVTVSYTKVVNKPHPYTDCRQQHLQPLKYSDKYTVPLCQQECKMEYVVKNCGCRDFRYPGNSTICDPQQFTECIPFYEAKFVEEQVSCNCTESCSSENYGARTSIAYFPNEHVMKQITALFNQSEDFIRKNYLDLLIFFEELSFNSVVQKPAYAFSSLISDVGGTMGLMVGMSLMTVAEVFDFYLIWLWKRFCKSELPTKD